MYTQVQLDQFQAVIPSSGPDCTKNRPSIGLEYTNNRPSIGLEYAQVDIDQFQAKMPILEVWLPHLNQAKSRISSFTRDQKKEEADTPKTIVKGDEVAGAVEATKMWVY